MTIPRRPRRRKPEEVESERDFERWVVDLAKLMGWRAFHSSDSRKQVRRGDRLILVPDPEQSGFVDWIFVRDRMVFAELKREKGKISPNQAVWIGWLRNAGAEVHVWRPSMRAEIRAVLAR